MLQSRGHQSVTALSSPASSPGDPPHPHPPEALLCGTDHRDENQTLAGGFEAGM